MRCLLRRHQTEASVPEPCMTTRLVRVFFFLFYLFFLVLQHKSNNGQSI